MLLVKRSNGLWCFSQFSGKNKQGSYPSANGLSHLKISELGVLETKFVVKKQKKLQRIVTCLAVGK
jgi:hypothetical protein